MNPASRTLGKDTRMKFSDSKDCTLYKVLLMVSMSSGSAKAKQTDAIPSQILKAQSRENHTA